MARKFRVAVKNVVLSQIDPADYPAVAGLIDGMHPTWRDWHRERSAFEMSARRQGHKIVYVPVEAAEFGPSEFGCGQAAGSGRRLAEVFRFRRESDERDSL